MDFTGREEFGNFVERTSGSGRGWLELKANLFPDQTGEVQGADGFFLLQVSATPGFYGDAQSTHWVCMLMKGADQYAVFPIRVLLITFQGEFHLRLVAPRCSHVPEINDINAHGVYNSFRPLSGRSHNYFGHILPFLTGPFGVNPPHLNGRAALAISQGAG